MAHPRPKVLLWRMRFMPFLVLGLVLGFGAAVFLVGPRTLRLIRYHEIAVRNLDDPCLANPDAAKKNPACKTRPHPLTKPDVPPPRPRYRIADPFWDRA